MAKFKINDTIRMINPSNVLTGMEGKVIGIGRTGDYGRWYPTNPTIIITKEPDNPFLRGKYALGKTFPTTTASAENLTEDSFELVTPPDEKLPRVIKPEEVQVGDKIQVDWTSDEIERRDTGVVASVKTSLPEFRNKLHVNIGPIVADERTITLLDRKVKHPLEDAVVGHVFKRTSVTGASKYKLTKLRDDHWALETTKGAHLVGIVIVSENKARTVYDS